MRSFLLIILSIVTLTNVQAQEKTKVLLLGVYHLANPGLDVAQLKVDDVLAEKRQQEIKAIVNSLKAFKPTAIFIEAKPQQQAYYDSLYAVYQKGGLRDKKREIIQIAFRAASEMGMTARQIRCVDSDNNFPLDSLISVAQTSGQKRIVDQLQENAEQNQTWFNNYLASHTIAETFTAMNAPERYQTDMYQYSGLINQIGTLTNLVGSYLVSEWWKRNITIQGNVLKSVRPDDKRIIIMYGAGHAAILDALFRLDPTYALVPVGSVLN